MKFEKLKLKLRFESAAWWRLEPQVGAASWCHGPDGSGREGAAAGCRCAAGRLAGWQAGKGEPLEADARPLQGCWTGSGKLGFSMTHTVLSKLCRTTCPFPDLPFLRTGLYLSLCWLTDGTVNICLWSSYQSLLRTNHLKLDWLISFSSHQRSGWGSLQAFLCRLTLLSLPLSLLWPTVGSKRTGIRGAYFRQGVSAPSNLELVRGVSCFNLTGWFECFHMVWMLSQSCRRLLRRGLQGTWGSSMTQDPTSGSNWSLHTNRRGSGLSVPSGGSLAWAAPGEAGQPHPGPDWSWLVISVLHIFWGFDTLASRFPPGGDNV